MHLKKGDLFTLGYKGRNNPAEVIDDKNYLLVKYDIGDPVHEYAITIRLGEDGHYRTGPDGEIVSVVPR